VLDSLSEDWAELDAQLTTQHQSCLEIQNTLTQIRERLEGLRKARRTIHASSGRRDSFDRSA
jgi:hypothetical protein